MTQEARYAIYYAPARHSPWWRFGAGWLGRDEFEDAPLLQPIPPGMTRQQLAALTEEPRRYGFHATLKAPFRLRAGATEALLLHRLQACARPLRPVSIGRLEPVWMDGFVALVPQVREPALDALAARCVLALDDLRAPPTAAELARHRPDRLDATGRELLALYGYPWVLGRFRFHLTLSGPVDAATAQSLLPHAQAALAAVQDGGAGMAILDRLCVFRQASPAASFVRIRDEVLASPAGAAA